MSDRPISKSPMSENPMSECLMCDRPMSPSPMCGKPMCYSPRIIILYLSKFIRNEGNDVSKEPVWKIFKI